MTDVIEVSRKGRVGVIRFNRPKQLNALNSEVAAATITAAQKMETDPDVGCIVLTGSEKAFAAGADISEMVGLTANEMVEQNYFAEWQDFVAVTTPKIAAVNGYALGGGCEVMMMCDFAIAGENAKFGQPEIKLGVMPGIGGSQRMTKLVGRSLSMDLHLTGRMMDAEEALRSGLIARVVPVADVFAKAMEAAETIAAYSRPVLRAVRGAVMQAEETPLDEGLRYERRAFHAMFGTLDQVEGMSAFLERRTAKFTGK